MTDQARTEQTKAPHPDLLEGLDELIEWHREGTTGEHDVDGEGQHDTSACLYCHSSWTVDVLKAFKAASPPLSGEVEELVAQLREWRAGCHVVTDPETGAPTGELVDEPKSFSRMQIERDRAAAALSSEHRGRVAATESLREAIDAGEAYIAFLVNGDTSPEAGLAYQRWYDARAAALPSVGEAEEERAAEGDPVPGGEHA